MAEIVHYFVPKLIDVNINIYINFRFIIIVKPIQLSKRNIIGKHLIRRYSRKWDLLYLGK